MNGLNVLAAIDLYRRLNALRPFLNHDLTHPATITDFAMKNTTFKEKLLADPLLVPLMKAAKLATVMLMITATLHFGLSLVAAS